MLELILENTSGAASLVTLPVCLYLVKQLKLVSGGSMASLKAQMNHLHEVAREQVKKNHKVNECTKESFWTAYKHYTNLGGNGRAKVWADDFERWDKNG